MSISRYRRRMLVINQDSMYRDFFKDRRRLNIKQYGTARFKYPTIDEINNLENIMHEWTFRDRFYKLADKFYGDPKLWWIIAFYNQTPTEFHLTVGDTVLIPLPLNKILRYMEV